MGDCASRPNYIETENHVRYTSTVNDAFFQEPVLLSAGEKTELLKDLGKGVIESQEKADSYMYSLNTQLQSVAQRLAESPEDAKTKLIVEIRKGMDIFPVGPRPSKGVLVKVATFPTAKDFTTPVVEAYIPKWYSLAYFTFSTEEPVDRISLTAVCLADTGVETTLAATNVDLGSGSDQTYTKWLLLTLAEEVQALKIKPQLEVRIWHLRNQYAFWYRLKEILEKEQREVSAALAQSRTGLLEQ